ncbi:MAG: hypothetical protein HeimC2_16500 [Candidatus Heimdallarchaeota archaeon LC_2]|nr:MAG: hypothetical protein HeimC2_16500 [Candidatus Heimdallarchaeota archaeon LC_2]
MKGITSLFIILIFLAPIVKGEQIYSFDSTINAKEINHVELTVLRDLELQFEGSTNQRILFFAFDSLNYQLWSEFLNYTTIDNRTLSGDFDFKFFVVLDINSTFHLLFINNDTLPVVMNLTVEELTTTTEGVPLMYFAFIVSNIFISLIYKKSIRSS